MFISHNLCGMWLLTTLGGLAVACGTAPEENEGTAHEGNAGTAPEENAGTAGAREGVPLAQFCQKLDFVSLCDAARRCRTSDAPTEAELPACREHVAGLCDLRFGGAAYRDGRIEWNPEGAADFIAEYHAAVQACGTVPVLAGTRLGIGQLGVGENCAGSEEDVSPMYACASGLTCDILDTLCVTGAALGESCRETPCQLSLGLICDQSSETCREIAGLPSLSE